MKVGAATLRRDVRAAYSYLASNDPRIHVGLGQPSGIRDVVVRWADGGRESFGDLPADGPWLYGGLDQSLEKIVLAQTSAAVVKTPRERGDEHSALAARSLRDHACRSINGRVR